MNHAIASVYAISITHEGHPLTVEQKCAIADKVPALIAEIERLERELAEAGRRAFQESRICYRGFSYGVGSQSGIDSLRSAISRNGHG